MGKSQAELDFVDVDARRDTRLFVDPYAISIKEDVWSEECADSIKSFFQEVLTALQANSRQRLQSLMSHLTEPQETFLGMSKGRPRGRGVGTFQASQILDALRSSEASRTGILSDLADAELFIEGIGPDKISDLTTNIIRGSLVRYTQEQCELHGITNLRDAATGPVWNASGARWESVYHKLPILDGRPTILIPKYSVRMSMSLNSQEFYNHHMIEFLRSEYLHAGSSLVHVLRDGRRKVYKSEVKERHPFAKDHLAGFVREHPQVLETYKRIKGAKGPLDDEDLDENFNEADFAKALSERLASIPPGMNHATEFHRFMIGVLTFFFYPDLIEPIKEQEINDGRKRIDIVFTNAAQSGLFHRALSWDATRALRVMIECKNYTKDMGNPELDQMSGRFSHTRGRFGILNCRQLEDVEKIRKSCRDCARDGRGYIIVLDDNDIYYMLDSIAKKTRSRIGNLLSQRLNLLTE